MSHGLQKGIRPVNQQPTELMMALSRKPESGVVFFALRSLSLKLLKVVKHMGLLTGKSHKVKIKYLLPCYHLFRFLCKLTRAADFPWHGEYH